MGCNYVFSIGQGINQMGKVLEKNDWKNNQKITKKKHMPFCHSPKNFVLKVVSPRKSKATREKEVNKAAIGGQEKKGKFWGRGL